ncbi:hypothetical protein Q3P06_19255 [Ralstonia pseudosolanacearum]|uniref:hypothetical protein n=1 Tax=Ralstonia pseudosolanacearum TaxID=1310165 RepID=UPI002675F574|nr:hypothetical protein [Ralstonia pseudosolanacearum]MDO3508350.1 hypothetical protein [Ralstonia pseudosolanacearum]MDO3514043.1 hypothetical protein [Ralstonia pseudosolanacearum]MDO3538480.1 hypothetical protein [Ralstonia pseudosolanacearum]MDO3606372.1 hypothetical protein [Ralstonia pseudosolanacearum]MDO3612430.1 hypothetical protein [Ralstonia pseudosolanacearum]
MASDFVFHVRPKNRRLSLLVMALGCTAALIALDKSTQTSQRLAAIKQQLSVAQNPVAARPSQPSEVDAKKSALASTIQTSIAVDWNRRLNLLESLRGEAVSIGLFKTTAADTKAELRLTSDTLEAANGALDRYARAAGEDLRPTVTSIAYRDRKYVTTATAGVR